jgi:hypothetical protein
VSELLLSGVRALDLRVGMHESEVHICHTVVCELTLSAALSEVSAFLQGAPGEVVVLLIKCDWEMRGEYSRVMRRIPRPGTTWLVIVLDG